MAAPIPVPPPVTNAADVMKSFHSAGWMIWRVTRQQEAAARRRQYREYCRGVGAISCASATPPGAARHHERTS
jgi:hypothetical protein